MARPAMAGGRQILSRVINNYLTFSIFVIDIDVAFGGIYKSLFCMTCRTVAERRAESEKR
jgi:hypothetical protein